MSTLASSPPADHRTDLPSDPLAEDPRAWHGQAEALRHGRHGDPFAILGPHGGGKARVVRAFLPGAKAVRAVCRDGDRAGVALRELFGDGLFSGVVDAAGPYELAITWPDGVEQRTEDPYAFGLLLGELDLHLINEGRHHELGRCLGAQATQVDGVAGVRFAVWAPNARRVSVVGDFNTWNGTRHPMRVRHPSGVWELFVPRLAPGERYQYEVLGADGHSVTKRADPVAAATEAPPSTASVVADPRPLRWSDEAWMRQRAHGDAAAKPMSIYEVQVGSWLHDTLAVPGGTGAESAWHFLAERLIPYARGLGFTHVELLPVMEHPFGGSWGYQPLGMFAPSARYGSPRDFAHFVDRCHAQGLGVILDWVPAHFPSDAHGLAQFDGTALYEYADPREGFHRDWNTLIYNLGRHEVRGFMIASALEWLERFHVDGLRVDAVASMLYRDYSREPGEWLPNRHGGRENLETVDFLRELNTVVHERCPGALTIAEESTAWPGVTHPVADGGLGFDFKWNMGWMHDSLRYMAHDPIHRTWHHDDLTFGLVYAFSERFVLPISHDEVVHGKGSLLGKMPGDAWQRFANLRAYLGFMWAHPGKKLLFMGAEIAQPTEWNHDAQLPWELVEQAPHAGVQALVRDLNGLHAGEPSLHEQDGKPQGFQWLIGDDRTNSVFAFLRHAAPDGPAATRPVLVVCNFTPVARANYRVGVPALGRWQERLNTDAAIYGGSNVGNGGGVEAEATPMHGQPASVSLTLPPLSVVFLSPAPAR